MCAVVIFGSFIPEMFPTFFGDVVCVKKHPLNSHLFNHGTDVYTHWGFRHWVWIGMGCCLFFWNIIDIAEENNE